MIDLASYQDPLTIQRVLYAAQTIAIVGLSRNDLRASYFVGFYLKRHGYRVIPVNPRETEILGETSYPSLLGRSRAGRHRQRLPRAGSAAGDRAEAVAIGAAALWCQFGVINEEGARIADGRWPHGRSWTAASRSSTPATSAGCTGSASTPSASPPCAAASNSDSNSDSAKHPEASCGWGASQPARDNV